MYKKQMTFQRIVCLAMIVACAIVFVYSLGLSTDLYDGAARTFRSMKNLESSQVEGAAIYFKVDEFNKTLTIVALGMLLVNLILYVTGTNSRRKYYIGNFISVGLSTVCNVGVSYWAVTELMELRTEYLKMDFKKLEEVVSTRANAYYTDSTFWFDAAWIVFGLVVLLTVLLIVNLVLKIIMMNSEKRLIGSRKDVRA